MKGSGHLTAGVTVACRVLQRLDGDGDRDGAVPLASQRGGGSWLTKNAKGVLLTLLT